MVQPLRLTHPDKQAFLRKRIEDALNHLDHVLPGQGPILDFIHHNTLHGYQHLSFEEALAASESLTGICGYWPESQFREFYRQGRITEEDLSAALARIPKLATEHIVLTLGDRAITRQEVYRLVLRFDLEAITASQFTWNSQEMNALERVQEDVPEPIRHRWLELENGVRELWQSLLLNLGLGDAVLHPENMLDLSAEQAEAWLAQTLNSRSEIEEPSVHQITRRHIQAGLDGLLAQVGDSISLPRFVAALSGVDIFECVRPQLVRICASALDQGIAAWRLPECDTLGLYAAWRTSLTFDINPYLHELPDWPSLLEQLPDDAVDAIIFHLTHLGIPEARWPGYLQRLALELPGWSGMINWRQRHPDSEPGIKVPLQLADYLAIRLTLDQLWLSQSCREIWKIEPGLDALESYFRKNLSEFFVRHQLFEGQLPEYLTQQAEQLIARAGSERHHRNDWQQLSDRIRTWQSSPMASQHSRYSVNNQGWRLFRLSQHLGLRAEQIDALSRNDLLNVLDEMDSLTASERSQIWLEAYERGYRENLFQALHGNRQRDQWHKNKRQRPEAQIVFCMDEREESFRRQLEELNPAIETLGAAGFFGVAMNYRGLDEDHVTPLCPVVIKPAHQINEVAKPGEKNRLALHQKGHQFFKKLAYQLHHSLRRELFAAHLKIDLFAAFSLVGLLADRLLPDTKRLLAGTFHRMIESPVETELAFNAANETVTDRLRMGFTDLEQADRVEGLLKTIGLTDIFAPIVCMMAHGSTSLNNPHEAAHDCGACGGRRGGPNARVFAAMANRLEVRSLLAERGILIPWDCWFVGAQHDTCSDAIIWYDLGVLPDNLKRPFARIQKTLSEAQNLSAQERCRRFASAGTVLSPRQAFRHVQQRASDTSQVRPEYGHATNASAFIGRRAATQGLFLDRRVFLISYDAAKDPESTVLENILLTAGPVGAGINLEYYFSTVNNERFGCGTKIPHNITGLFGVMEGVSGDLRTGLPLQMVEIHEAMRLQVVVEAPTSALDKIYHRQESLRELIAGGWVHLSSIDPDSGEIFIFERGKGFVPWIAQTLPLPVYNKSQDYYLGQTQALPPVLIRPNEAVSGA